MIANCEASDVSGPTTTAPRGRGISLAGVSIATSGESARSSFKTVCWVVLALVFALTASFKYAQFWRYAVVAERAVPQWLPQSITSVVVGMIPTLEAGTVILLFVRRWRRQGGVLAAALLIVVTAGAWGRYSDGVLHGGCGCAWPVLRFLAPPQLSWFLARNLGLFLLCVAVIAENPPTPSPPAVSS